MPSKTCFFLRGLALAFGVAELDDLVAAAVEHDLLHLRRQLVPRCLDIEVVVLRERLDELEVVGVTPIPAADRAAGEREVGVRDHARGIEELLHAETVAGGAGAATGC